MFTTRNTTQTISLPEAGQRDSRESGKVHAIRCLVLIVFFKQIIYLLKVLFYDLHHPSSIRLCYEPTSSGHRLKDPRDIGFPLLQPSPRHEGVGT